MARRWSRRPSLFFAVITTVLAPHAAADTLFVSTNRPCQLSEILGFALPSNVPTVVVSSNEVIFDGACSPGVNGDIYFTQPYGTPPRLTRWRQSGAGAKDIVPPPNCQAQGPSFDSAGNLYFYSNGPSDYGVYVVPGAIPGSGRLLLSASFGSSTVIVPAGPHAGALLLVDSNGRILMSDPPGAPLTTLIALPTESPIGIAANGCGDVFVSVPSGAIRHFSPTGDFVEYYARFPSPGYMEFDSMGNLYVTSGEDTIWKIGTDRRATVFYREPGLYPMGVAVCRDAWTPCKAGLPYVQECAGHPTCVHLDGQASAKCSGSATFSWTSDCPGADFGGTEHDQWPTLCLDPAGCETQCHATLTISDGGKVQECTAEITVADTAPPEINSPADVVIACGLPTDPSATGSATADDDCDDGSPAITFSDAVAPGRCPPERTITRTWRATDACGNATSRVQVIHVVDAMSPVIACPPDHAIPLGGRFDPLSLGSATATDDCDESPTITFSDAVVPRRCPQERMRIRRTWTATDACGNTASCAQVIKVVDQIAPVMLACPEDDTIVLPPDVGPAARGLRDGDRRLRHVGGDRLP